MGEQTLREVKELQERYSHIEIKPYSEVKARLDKLALLSAKEAADRMSAVYAERLLKYEQ